MFQDSKIFDFQADEMKWTKAHFDIVLNTITEFSHCNIEDSADGNLGHTVYVTPSTPPT